MGWKSIAIFMAVISVAPRGLDLANGLFKDHEDCRILWVIDGDTVKVVCPKSGYVSARIMGFDTPEKRARCFKEAWMAFAATQRLRWELYRAQHIRTWPRGFDIYDRQLVAVAVDGDGLANRMAQSGFARPYFGGQRRSWCREGALDV